MGIFCGSGALTGMTTSDYNGLISRIRIFLGEPVMGVELENIQIETCIAMAIEEYSSYIHDWSMKNNMAEMLGLPSEIDFTLKYVSHTINFEKAQVVTYGEQAGGGVNSVRESKTGIIVLSGGVQDYVIPAGREVNDVLWYTPSFVNITGIDPFSSQNIAFTEFGASYAGNSLFSVMPVFDTILTAQAAELRNRVRGSEYSYILRGGPDGTKILKLLPVPYPGNAGGNFGNLGTPGRMFYTYFDKTPYGNSLYSGNTANPGFSGYTSEEISLGYQGNGLVSSPADARLYFISYNQLNDPARQWVKRFALALSKEVLGLSIRGKFNGQLPIPGAELTLNKDDLINTGRDDQEKLKNELKERLAELTYDKIMERRTSIQENINKTLGFGPLGIYLD